MPWPGGAGRDQAIEAAGLAVQEEAVGFVEAEVGARREGTGLEQEAQQALGRATGGVEAPDDAAETARSVSVAVGEWRQARSRARTPAG